MNTMPEQNLIKPHPSITYQCIVQTQLVEKQRDIRKRTEERGKKRRDVDGIHKNAMDGTFVGFRVSE